MRRLIAIVLAVDLAILAAWAGVTKTERPGRHELRNAAGTLLGLYDTHAACVAAIPAPATAQMEPSTCKAVTHIDTVGNCDGVPRPALATFTVEDPDGVVYAGPYCAPGETCTTPPDWDVRSTTYTDVGGLRLNEDGSADEYKLVQGAYPSCWAWQWVPVVPEMPVADNGDGHVPPAFDPGAFDGESEAGATEP